MSFSNVLYECSNEELIKIIKILDDLMELDEHLFKTSPYLKPHYQSFKFHNRMIRSEAWAHLKNMSFQEHNQYNYPNLKKRRTESE